MAMRFTMDEFEELYAQRVGVEVEELKAIGLHAVPCPCKESWCLGFDMASETPEVDPQRVLADYVAWKRKFNNLEEDRRSA